MEIESSPSGDFENLGGQNSECDDHDEIGPKLGQGRGEHGVFEIAGLENRQVTAANSLIAEAATFWPLPCGLSGVVTTETTG